LSGVSGIAIDVFLTVIVNIVSCTCVTVAAVFLVEDVIDCASNA
jgi:hypothetical protein